LVLLPVGPLVFATVEGLLPVGRPVTAGAEVPSYAVDLFAPPPSGLVGVKFKAGDRACKALWKC
jgi:hypothetical protein